MYDTTILIPARIRNAQEMGWLNLAVNSAMAQGKIVIAYNNCEHTPLTKFAKKATVHTIDAKNLAAVRNFLVRQVKTPYYLFLDADDLLIPESIEKMEVFIKTVPEKRYVYGGTVIFGQGHLEIMARDFDCEALTRGVYFPNGVLQPIQNFEIVGQWDEKLDVLEDKDWWLMAAENGIIGVPLKEHLTYKYRQHDNSMVHALKNTPVWNNAQLYIADKHKSFYDGEYPPMCNCNKKNNTPTLSYASASGSSPLPEPGPGQLRIHYNMGTGSVTYYGPMTGSRYEVSASKPNILISESDGTTNSRSKPGLLELVKSGKAVFSLI